LKKSFRIKKKNGNKLAEINEKLKELDEQERNSKADDLEEDSKLKEKRELEDKLEHEDELERQVESEQADDCKKEEARKIKEEQKNKRKLARKENRKLKKQRRKEEDDKRNEERRKRGECNERKMLKDKLEAIKREQKELKEKLQDDLMRIKNEMLERDRQLQDFWPLNDQDEFSPIRVEYISYDEKPGIQALSPTNPDLPCSSSFGWIGRCHEYKRLGTMDLLAGQDIVTGEIISLIRPTHKSSDFIDWLKIIDAKYHDSAHIKIVMDNHSTHLSAETKAFLDSRPGRFEFIFTPTHASWLNMIESFFGKLSRVCLKHIRVGSKDELSERIYRYINESNKNPVVYKWKYKINVENDTTEKAGS
jgi:transposase